MEKDPTLYYASKAKPPPIASRYVAIACPVTWCIAIPLIFASPLMNAGGKFGGTIIITSVGLGLPIIGLIFGFSAYVKIHRITGQKPRMLSWCLAMNAAILLLFGFFLLLLWPIVLKSR